MTNEPKFLIIGRSGTGKDYLKSLLVNMYDWNFVNSMTTRPKRTKDENTHIFISKEEASHYNEHDKVAKTIINDYEYFATKQQVEECNAYIIDPEGAEMLLERMPDTWFEIVYLKTSDDAQRKQMAIDRSDDPNKEQNIFNERNDAEASRFENFETYITNNSFDRDNAYGIHVIENDFTEKTMTYAAIALEMRLRFYRQMRKIIDHLSSDTGILEKAKHTDGIILFNKTTDEPVNVCTNKLIQIMAEEPKNSIFATIMENYLFSKPETDKT